MRVLVAGATGVIGRQLVPLLTAGGHEVVAVSRTVKSSDDPKVKAVQADALDPESIGAAVRDAKPDAIVHVLTAIPAKLNPRKAESDFALTNRLRDEGTRNILAAAREVGTPRIVAQGIAFAYDPSGSAPAHEDVPLWNDLPKPWQPSLAGLRSLEAQVAEANGLVLRIGHLYGPGTHFASDGDTVAQVRAGKMPVVGKGSSTFSFTHVRDAAAAFAAAVTSPVTGVLNVVDDEPVLIGEWLPELAGMLGARKPPTVPTPIARLAAGSWGVAFMTKLRGADNTRAKEQLGWEPQYASWRDGFAAEFAAG